MRAIIVQAPGGAENMYIGVYKQPKPGEKEILIKVEAAGVNRADILQRKGKYPPPAGASTLLGLEISGTVVKAGPGCVKWKQDDQIMGLLPGGGYAEYAVIHEDMAIAKPSYLTFEEAAAIPEVYLTAFQALVWIARLRQKERVLLHAGASGVGTAAIQLAKTFDAEVFVTASSGKHEICRSLGADHLIDYQKEQFDERIKSITGSKGVDVIVDFVGGPYFSANINSLSIDGRMVILALLGSGPVTEIDLRKIIGKRLTISGSTLRSRHLEYQIRLTQEFADYGMHLFESGKLKPVVDKVFNWNDVPKAHTYMEENKNSGKIILKII
jgi:tumor protein p53-inducible protein 3